MRIRSSFAALVLAFSYFIGFVEPASAATIGNMTPNCSSSLTTSSGTFVTSVVESGSFCIVVFYSNTNTDTATGSWTAPYSNVSITYLVVGGGGSGSRGTCGTTYGPGGGGGGVQTGTNVFSGALTVQVGGGGNSSGIGCPASIVGNSGGSSKFAAITANGGSGAGVGKTGGTSGNNHVGGTASDSGCGECGAGGGGGAGGVGGDSRTPISGMNAGPGVVSDLTSTSVEYGSGGAGRSGSNFGVARGGGGSANNSGGSGSCNATTRTGGGGSDCGAGWGAGGSGLVVIKYAFDATAPSFLNSSSFSIAENTATTSNAATITVSESSTITINSSGDHLRVTLVTSDSTTARIRFTAIPNFESPLDSGGNNVYDLSVRATDTAGNAANQSITITVTNVNEAPEISIATSAATHTISQAENITSVLTYTGSDVDAGTTLTWSISGTDAADFSMNSSTGVLVFAANPDFEGPADADANNVYIVVVTLSDGSLTDTQTVTITITNASESGSISAPTISGAVSKGVAIDISVTVNTAGKVRFFVGNKRINNCLARSTTGSYPSFTATCSWRPAVTGRQSLTATVTPTDNTFSASTSAPTTVQVVRRTTSR